jgi:hypothetical protein
VARAEVAANPVNPVTRVNPAPRDDAKNSPGLEK